jgi:hypothetical protein
MNTYYVFLSLVPISILYNKVYHDVSLIELELKDWYNFPKITQLLSNGARIQSR